ncbi:MAG: HD-GYP domain-containing protein [Veillonellales bacterium]
MQRISISHLKPGMTLSRNIFSADGLLLLNVGIKLTRNYISRLKKLGIASVYVDNPLLTDIEAPEIIQEETRVKAIATVKQSFSKLQTVCRIDIGELQQVANRIVDEAIQNRHTMVHLTDIRTHDDYTFGHSVNVCVLAVVTGLHLGYHTDQLRTLALGAMLHDVGKLSVPLEILNKPGRLTEDEMSIMKQHSGYGFSILQQQTDSIPLLAAHIAFQHHEKFNGTGYPRCLQGDDIHEFARIVAIADVYDALTADRPYRKCLPPHQAYEWIMVLTGQHFDPYILSVFLSHIAAYPVGTFVRLTSGEIGIVTKVLPKLSTRPQLRILTDSSGQFLSQPAELNMLEHLTLFIDKVLTDKEVYALQSQISGDIAHSS